MKLALSGALAALLLSACLDAGDVNEEGLVGVEHDPAEAAANEAETEIAQLLAQGALENGVPVAGLTGIKGSQQFFTLAVPEGATNLKIAIAGGTGDADLYVRYGEAPTTTKWDYRPYYDGNNETVVPAPIKVGTYHLMLRGYTPYAGVTLTASFTAPSTSTPDGGTPDAAPPPPPPPPPPTGPDCTNPASWPAEWVAFEDQVLVLVNQQRLAGATCGGVVKPPVPALTMSPALRQAARCHSFDMAKQNYFSHTSLDGRTPWQRIADAGYNGFGNAENIAAGQGSAAAVMQSWMTSDGHCNNIMNNTSTKMGVGYGFDASSTYDRYWTQTFGKGGTN